MISNFLGKLNEIHKITKVKNIDNPPIKGVGTLCFFLLSGLSNQLFFSAIKVNKIIKIRVNIIDSRGASQII